MEWRHGLLPSQQVHLVDVDCLFVPVEREDDPEADGRFSEAAEAVLRGGAALEL